MAKADEKIYFFDRKANIRRVLYSFYALCFVLFIADFFVDRHTYQSLEDIPAFYALFGFAAYVLLVIVSALLRKLMMRPEDYYEAPEVPDE